MDTERGDREPEKFRRQKARGENTEKTEKITRWRRVTGLQSLERETEET